MNTILTNLESTTKSMNRAVGRIDAIIAEGKVDSVLEEAPQVNGGNAKLIKRNTEELRSMEAVRGQP